MAGKRLLDAAKLVQATRAVARQHIDLRSEQLNRYNRTSTLAKEIKNQTDRVTVTVQAAIELAKRLAEDEKKPWEEEVQGQGRGTKPEREVKTIVVEPETVSPSSTALPDSQNGSIGEQVPPSSMKSQIEADIPATEDSIQPDVAKTPHEMRESRVPSTRLGRLWQYGGLATSMACGAVGESLRRATGGEAGGSLILSPTNMERLVAKLSRMRGAALKLGQMISFQGILNNPNHQHPTNHLRSEDAPSSHPRSPPTRTRLRRLHATFPTRSSALHQSRLRLALPLQPLRRSSHCRRINRTSPSCGLQTNRPGSSS
jgi:hypothetical protein